MNGGKYITEVFLKCYKNPENREFVLHGRNGESRDREGDV